YPDGAFESRYPLHIEECQGQGCLGRLRQHLLEDRLAGGGGENLMHELFLDLFDLGVRQRPCELASSKSKSGQKHKWSRSESGSSSGQSKDNAAHACRVAMSRLLQEHRDVLDGGRVPDFLRAEEVLDVVLLAAALARRLQLLIENVSVTLLLNFHIVQLEHNGRIVGRNLVQEMYGDASSLQVVFHEIPGKRWDALTHLLDLLGVSEHAVQMAEVGVEAANTSQRLLERNPFLSYIGVDPYFKNDRLYADVLQRLSFFIDAGRFTLHRNTSLNASLQVADESLDIVFLDARHDYEAVLDDVAAWKPKVREGGILSGHDFSWMFPTVAMAVFKETFNAPDRTMHLAPDGVWWDS
ncbi:Hypothetical protein SCF082_LOCUS2406, partial [Durusdinium trenchii]